MVRPSASSSNMEKLDAFPGSTIRIVGEWKEVPSIPKVLKLFTAHSNAFLLRVDQENNYKTYNKLKEYDDKHQLTVDNMRRTITDKRPLEFTPLKWARTFDKLKTVFVEGKKYVDQRQHYRHNHIYAVQKHFTFGKRTVAAGEYHVIQTLQKKLVVYLQQAADSFPQRAFNPHHQKNYRHVLLDLRSVYCVPPGVTYVILTYQKTVFQIDKVTSDVFGEIERMHQVRNVCDVLASRFDLAPATPSMDQFLQAREEAEERYVPEARPFFVDTEGFVVPGAPPRRSQTVTSSSSLRDEPPVRRSSEEASSSFPSTNPPAAPSEEASASILLPAYPIDTAGHSPNMQSVFDLDYFYQAFYVTDHVEQVQGIFAPASGNLQPSSSDRVDPPPVSSSPAFNLQDPPVSGSQAFLLQDPPVSGSQAFHLPDPPVSGSPVVQLPDPPVSGSPVVQFPDQHPEPPGQSSQRRSRRRSPSSRRRRESRRRRSGTRSHRSRSSSRTSRHERRSERTPAFPVAGQEVRPVASPVSSSHGSSVRSWSASSWSERSAASGRHASSRSSSIQSPGTSPMSHRICNTTEGFVGSSGCSSSSSDDGQFSDYMEMLAE